MDLLNVYCWMGIIIYWLGFFAFKGYGDLIRKSIPRFIVWAIFLFLAWPIYVYWYMRTGILPNFFMGE